MKVYPIVKIPDYNKKFESECDLNDFKSFYKLDIKNKPSKPLTPKEPFLIIQKKKFTIEFKIRSYFYFILIFIILFNVFMNYSKDKLLVVIFLIAAQIFNTFRIIKKNKSINIKKSLVDIQNYEYDMAVFNGELFKYNSMLKIYEEDLKNLKTLFEQSKSSYYTDIYPILIKSEFTIDKTRLYPSKGYSENYFKNFLIRKQLNVVEDCYPSKYCEYFPDIVIQCQNILMDLEIDEPYVYKTKEPIHYLDNISDTKRNDFFLDCNWVVLRFTEFQIMNYTEECYLTIINVFQHITNNIPLKTIISSPVWTFEEAQKMAMSNYRNEYLNKDFFQVI